MDQFRSILFGLLRHEGSKEVFVEFDSLSWNFRVSFVDRVGLVEVDFDRNDMRDAVRFCLSVVVPQLKTSVLTRGVGFEHPRLEYLVFPEVAGFETGLSTHVENVVDGDSLDHIRPGAFVTALGGVSCGK